MVNLPPFFLHTRFIWLCNFPAITTLAIVGFFVAGCCCAVRFAVVGAHHAACHDRQKTYGTQNFFCSLEVKIVLY